MLKVENIDVSYGEVKVLHDVSVDLEKGEMVVIIGPNGAGKSTVLKSVIGLLVPTAGKITFKGKEITGLKPHLMPSTGIGYVPQGRIVFEDMTVQENLEMGAFIIDDKKATWKNMEKVFQRFPRLEERKKQKAGTMSGGEQQMLAIGRALMVNPELLILDEPSLGLSPKYIDIIFALLTKLRDDGTTILMVEQNAARALEISDRGYVLELGKNRYHGTGMNLLKDEKVKMMYLGG
jgi:branched-chain amino acid transport system ATP-binding protein